MAKKYSKTNILDFGKFLLLSKDLDPVYVMLHEATELDQDQLFRWLVAYWSFYHCGVACYMSEFKGEEFWKVFFKAVENNEKTPLGTRWPRGSERRYYRGKQGYDSAVELKNLYGNSPEAMVEKILTGDMDYQSVANRVKEHRGFGDWIAFKVADMVDRVLAKPVNFTEADVFMFKEPKKSAIMLWKANNPELAEGKLNEDVIIKGVVAYLKDYFKEYSAPPLADRKVDLQEVETILCKWKSHINGHYPFYNDIDEIREGLQHWSECCETAKLLLKTLPENEEHAIT